MFLSPADHGPKTAYELLVLMRCRRVIPSIYFFYTWASHIPTKLTTIFTMCALAIIGLTILYPSDTIVSMKEVRKIYLEVRLRGPDKCETCILLIIISCLKIARFYFGITPRTEYAAERGNKKLNSCCLLYTSPSPRDS